MTYEQEVIFKCAIKGTIGGLQEKLTAEDFDELLILHSYEALITCGYKPCPTLSLEP